MGDKMTPIDLPIDLFTLHVGDDAGREMRMRKLIGGRARLTLVGLNNRNLFSHSSKASEVKVRADSGHRESSLSGLQAVAFLL